MKNILILVIILLLSVGCKTNDTSTPINQLNYFVPSSFAGYYEVYKDNNLTETVGFTVIKKVNDSNTTYTYQPTTESNPIATVTVLSNNQLLLNNLNVVWTQTLFGNILHLSVANAFFTTYAQGTYNVGLTEWDITVNQKFSNTIKFYYW